MSLFKRRLLRNALGASAASATVLAVVLAVAGGQASADKLPPVTPAPLVTVAEMQPQAVVAAREYPGRAESARRVEVRARVGGILSDRRYDEGALVVAGQTLFRIDPDRHAVQVQRAEAELRRAMAQLEQARRDWARVAKLFDSRTVSERDRDQALSAYELAKAEVGIAEAALNDARIQLAYTEVKAPIAGVTSQEALSEGNLVQEQTLLTTIVQLDPIHVQFAISEADALALRRARQGEPLAAALLLADGSVYHHRGAIDFTGSSVDPRTGTVQARAVFRNPQGEIMPGQFLRVSLSAEMSQQVMVVPSSAISQGASGPIVYVVNAAQRVEERSVQLGDTVDHGIVVHAGLQAGDRVVVNGITRVHPNDEVRVALAGEGEATIAAQQHRDPAHGEPERA